VVGSESCESEPRSRSPKDACICKQTVRNGRPKSSKVVDFGTNRKRVCDFLLVINGNLGPTLRRFRDIAAFLVKTATPPLFHQKFSDVSIGLDRRRWGYEERKP